MEPLEVSIEILSAPVQEGNARLHPLPPQKEAEPFTVIFEYGIPKRSRRAV